MWLGIRRRVTSINADLRGSRMKKSIAAAVLGLCLAQAAFAGEFDGVSAGISLNAVGAETTASGGGDSLTLGQTSYNGSLFAQYGVMSSDSALVSFGASYDIGNTNSGEGSAGGSSFRVVGENHYSIYFEPGVLVNKHLMFYGRVGYHSFDGRILGLSGTRSFDGAGLAFGMRTKINREVSLQTEVEGVSYSSETYAGTTYKPKTVAGKVALVYQFK